MATPEFAQVIGAMSVVIPRLTSVLLATLLLASDGLAVMPLVIAAVVVVYMASARPTGRADRRRTSHRDFTRRREDDRTNRRAFAR